MSYSKKLCVLWKLTVHYCVHRSPLKSEVLCDFLKFRVISPSSKSQLPHLSQLLSQHPLSYPAYLKSIPSFPNWVRATLWSHCTHVSLLYFNKKNQLKKEIKFVDRDGEPQSAVDVQRSTE
jgi:hypothetical protein